jgi:rod shape-determining protein MreD
MIAEIFVWVIFFVVCFVLQTTLVPVINIFGIQPDLTIIALMILALRHGSMSALWVGFTLGLAQDIYSPSILGQNALAKTVIGVLVGLFNERVMNTEPIVKLIILLVAFFVHDTIFMAIEVLKNGSTIGALFMTLLVKTAPRAVYSIGIAILYYVWEYFSKPPSLKR